MAAAPYPSAAPRLIVAHSRQLVPLSSISSYTHSGSFEEAVPLQCSACMSHPHYGRRRAAAAPLRSDGSCSFAVGPSTPAAPRLIVRGALAESFFLPAKIPYATMPHTERDIPVSSFTPICSFRYSQLPRRTSTVFAWPVTWKVTALKRPRHMNCEMFTKTATEQDMARQTTNGTDVS